MKFKTEKNVYKGWLGDLVVLQSSIAQIVILGSVCGTWQQICAPHTAYGPLQP